MIYRMNAPLREELEDQVLALLRQPRLAAHISLDLLEIHLEDLRRERRDEVLCEHSVLLLHRARQLTRVAVPMEQPPKHTVRPLLRLPPLTLFPFTHVVRNSARWDVEVHDLEEQTAPRDERFCGLLVCAEIEDDGRAVGFEDVMEDGRDLGFSAGRRRRKHLGCEGDKSREELDNDLG